MQTKSRYCYLAFGILALVVIVTVGAGGPSDNQDPDAINNVTTLPQDPPELTQAIEASLSAPGNMQQLDSPTGELSDQRTALGTGFTYQGQLKLSGTPVENPVNIQFDLYDADTVGTLLGSQTILGVDPAGGLFTVTLNDAGQFGANAFTGEARWLQITVNGTLLTPRQRITATPYALKVPGIDGNSLDAPGAGPTDAVAVDVSGRVGIGTTSPQTKLHLFDSGVADMRIEGGTAGSPARRATLSLRSDVSGRARGVLFEAGDDPASWFAGAGYGGGRFTIGRDASQPEYAINSLFSILDSGNVGIKNPNPTELLHIGTGADKAAIQFGLYSCVGQANSSAATILGDNVKPAGPPLNGMVFMTDQALYPGGRAILMQSDAGIAFHTSDSGAVAGAPFSHEIMRIGNDGRVGIGTTTPASKLEVNGTIQMTGLKLSTAPTPGYVLTCDAAGVGTWQAATGGGGGGTVTSVATGTGLTGGPITTSGTISIADGGVGTAQIADGAVTAAKIAGTLGDITSVNTDNSLTGGGGTGDLTLSIANGGVTSTHIADGAVTSADILDGTIATIDLGANCVGSGQLAAGAVGTAQLAGNSVTTAQIVDGAVASSDILDSTIAASDLASDAASLNKVSGGAISYASGNIGIGNPAPLEKLDITGNIHATGTIRSGSSITIEGASGAERISSAANLDLNVASGRAMRFESTATSPNVIGGSSSNVVTSSVVGATIGGGGIFGENNQVTGDFGTVSGGAKNIASVNATVGGGVHNTAGTMGVIGGGQENVAGFGSTVGGGRSNVATAAAEYATIAGGGPGDPFNPTTTNNIVYDNYGSIGGGGYNRAGSDDLDPGTAAFATVGGGYQNTASGLSSTVGGGAGNTASGTGSTVGGGGTGNIASGVDSNVDGGYGNTASGSISTIGGGANNSAHGEYSTVGGGQSNQCLATATSSTIGGGEQNHATGQYATIPGGNTCTAGGDYSFAAGRLAKVRDAATVGDGDTNGDEGTFVWADSTIADFQSTGPNQFLIRASGGVGIGTNSPTFAQLHVVEDTSGKTAISAEHTALSSDTPAIFGIHQDSAGAYGVGVQGKGGYKGVEGYASRTANYPAFGVRGEVTDGPAGSVSYGVYGNANASGTNYGVYGTASTGTANWAGYFVGDVAVTGKLQVQDGTPDDSSVILPTGSISATETRDEPGVASAINDTVLNLTGAFDTLVSRSLNAPATGYVMVIATCEAIALHSNGTADSANFGVSDTSGSLPPNQSVTFTIPSGAPNGTYVAPTTVHGLFSVGAGAHTFYLLGDEVSGGMSAAEMQLTLVYFPTAYGTVTSTLISSPQPPGSDEITENAPQGSSPTGEEVASVPASAEQPVQEPVRDQVADLQARIQRLEATVAALTSHTEGGTR